MKRLARWAPWMLLVGALAYRSVYFAQIRGNPYFDAPIMDEGYHDLWAREIAHGDWAARIPFYRAPLYPALLGVVYRLFGADPPPFAWIRGVQLLVGALTPFLVLRLARRLVPGRPAIAWIAAVLTAADGMLLYFESDMLLESLLAPLAVGSLLLMLRAGENGAPRRWLLAGVVLGAFAITRPNILAFTPLLFVGALGWRGETFSWRRLQLGAAAALTVGVCLLVLPVTALNRFVGHDRTFLAWQGGINFFLGNNPEANGWSATAPKVLGTDWWGGYNDAIRIAEDAAGHKLSPAEISDYWFERGVAWWREHPRTGVLVTAKKAVFFLSGLEFSNNRDIRLFLEHFAPAGRSGLLLMYALVPLAVAGCFVFWRTGRPGPRIVVLWVLVYSATIIAFFVTARYRVPLRPVFAILAATGALSLADGIRRRERRAWLAAAGVVLIGIGTNVNPWLREYRPSPAQFYQAVANIHQDKGRTEQALDWQKRALAVDPAFPEGNLNEGTLYMALGRPADAVASFQRERHFDPDDGRNLASLGQAYAKLGRLEEADQAYADAEATGLVDARELYNHGVALERLGRTVDAGGSYRRAVEADSTFADAWNNLGVLAARDGRLDEAIGLWRTALARDPAHAGANDNLKRATRMQEGDRP